MRWRPAPTGVARKLWHRHFAWRPVQIWGTWHWLETVERRLVPAPRDYLDPLRQMQWTWEYRTKRSRA